MGDFIIASNLKTTIFFLLLIVVILSSIISTTPVGSASHMSMKLLYKIHASLQKIINPEQLGRTGKAQSAMEYLMTYGWAILIIVVVLGALFSLGVFGQGNTTGNSCVASTGYLCKTAELGTNGVLALTFGQNVASNIYNVNLACAATQNALGYPGLSPGTPGAVAFNALQAWGSMNTLGSYNGMQLPSGQTVSIGTALGSVGITCIGATGVAIGTQPVGGTFSGFIWLNYTVASAWPPGPTNPWYTTKIAAVNLKVA